ncbi:hypothetical protein, partial [Porphyromonas uenonis]|uniref:hypothetical protein n=1 Tax=Porphyromonas uenonis TaxID=281920 RepID=UPI0026E92B0B
SEVSFHSSELLFQTSEEMSVFHGAIYQLLRGDYLFGIKWKVIETVKDDFSQTRRETSVEVFV